MGKIYILLNSLTIGVYVFIGFCRTGIISYVALSCAAVLVIWSVLISINGTYKKNKQINLTIHGNIVNEEDFVRTLYQALEKAKKDGF